MARTKHQLKLQLRIKKERRIYKKELIKMALEKKNELMVVALDKKNEMALEKNSRERLIWERILKREGLEVELFGEFCNLEIYIREIELLEMESLYLNFGESVSHWCRVFNIKEEEYRYEEVDTDGCVLYWDPYPLPLPLPYSYLDADSNK
jgi:hypothetical protein